MADAVQRRLRVRVQGMDCPEEAAVVRRALDPMDGIQGILPDFSTGIATITVTPKGPSIDEIADAIRAQGLGAEPADETTDAPASWWAENGRTAATVASAGLIAGGVTGHILMSGFRQAMSDEAMPLPARIVYGLAILLCAGPIFPRAIGALRSLRLDMNVLLIVAVTGAVVLGDWFEAATVSMLYSFSLVLEGWTARRAMRAIGDLLGSKPTTARVAGDEQGAEREMAVEVVADESRVRDIIPKLLAVGATAIIEYPLNKVIP